MRMMTDQAENLLLEVRGLKKHFPVHKGVFERVAGRVRAVDGVDLEIRDGEALGLVGESGCGKTTAGRTILRLLEPTAGRIRFWEGGQGSGPRRVVEVTAADKERLKQLRRHMQIIYQDPYSSLNARMTVSDIVGEPLLVFGLKDPRLRAEKVRELLLAVGLNPEHMRRYPHEFSGGQRQRIAIARALILNPSLIVADEPVSALDVSVQAQVLALLKDLQARFHLTYLFITHDLAVVRYLCHRVAVMYLGRVVETAGTEELFTNPRHPYTEALISAVPVPDPDYASERIILKGDVPSPLNPPAGCHFHPRCLYAQEICRQEEPVYEELKPGHSAACHFKERLDLRAVGQGS